MRFMSRVTRKGAFLASIGLLYVGYGYSLDTIVQQRDSQAVFGVVLEVVPLTTWAVVWGVAGVTALLAGLAYPRLEPVAFGAMMTLASLWLINFLLAQPLYGVPLRQWLGGIRFGALTASVGIVAGWPNVKKLS